MNGRVADAVTGRFLSADPFVPHPSLTQSYNRYAYVRNNPLSFVDPSGFNDFQSGDGGPNLPEVVVNGQRWNWNVAIVRPDQFDDFWNSRRLEIPRLPESFTLDPEGEDADDAADAQAADQGVEEKSPQGPPGVQCIMEAPLVYAESKMGAFGEGKISTPAGKVHLNMDVASVNQSTTGENYFSQGFNLELRVFQWEIGLGINREAPIDGKVGKPNWESPRVLLGFKNLSLSKDGLDWSVGGGVFVGFNAGTSPIRCGGLGQ
jgi:hypothetical protein